MSRSARRPGFNNTVACTPGTWCVTDPNDPACRTCTYYDENCEAGLSYRECDPVKLKCTPTTLFCNPDPLNRFCNICTDIDADCQFTTHQECIGVPIPNKVVIPEPGRRSVVG